MNKLHSVESPQTHRLTGFLDAAQHVFTKGELSVKLSAICFDVLDDGIRDDDVVRAAYSHFNPIENRTECSLEHMIARVHNTLTLSRKIWATDRSSVLRFIENDLREVYWTHVKACFDYTSARIVELGPHVPFVNIAYGFTYILYAPNMRQCMLLVGNVSD